MISRYIIERPKHKLSIFAIYGTAFATVPRCPSIYIAILLFWILIGVVMVAAMIGVGMLVFSSLAVIPLYVNIFSGIRFVFGLYLAVFLAWAAIFGVCIVVLRAGLAGMYLRLHQGYRPRLADFGAGIARYSWRFLKGYFHIVILYAVPLLVVLGWIMLRYSAYSSLIFESRWNTGLRFDFILGNQIAFNIAFAIMAIIYCLLMVWDESVVLEGSTFQLGFLRSLRFIKDNILRLLGVAIINFIIVRIVFFGILFIVMSIRPESGTLGSDILWNPTKFLHWMYIDALPTFWFYIIMFFISPILAYTHYLLYIPNRPFRPYAYQAVKIKPGVVSLTDESEEQEPEWVMAGADEPLPRPIFDYREEKTDTLTGEAKKDRAKLIADEDEEEPKNDFLRLDN